MGSKGKEFAIMVLGVAGVGKTKFGKALAQKLGLRFIDIPELVKTRKLYSSYDPSSQAYVVDLRRISAAAGSELRGAGGVISSIYAFKPRRIKVRCAIVLRMNPLKLLRVLEEREYPRDKIGENVSAELIDHPLVEAIRRFGRSRVIQVDVTDVDLNELAGKFAEAIRSRQVKKLDVKVDWISELEKSGKLEDLLRFIEASSSEEVR
ncbi:MAG: AAA family ATPase [Thaumarchaeota archaeon]|nr:AAA family ATPase [Nitrososphaerota archaeon]